MNLIEINTLEKKRRKNQNKKESNTFDNVHSIKIS